MYLKRLSCALSLALMTACGETEDAGAGRDLDLGQTGQALYAAYDATVRAPRCALAASSCDSGDLLVGRGTVGPEQSAPNTVNGCADGSAGTFHVSPSLDGIKVATYNGTVLAPGKTAQVNVRVWASSAYANERLDLYYAANASAPSWFRIGTYTPVAAGAQTFSVLYTLPSGGTMQVLRGRYRSTSTAVVCGSGSYNDHDDLVFAVGVADTTAPEVSLTWPAEGASVPAPMSLSASATDHVGVTRVEAYEGTTLIGTDTTSPYSIFWRSPSLGSHTVVVKAFDAAGNIASSTPVTFTVVPDTTAPTTSITSPAEGARVAASTTLSATAADDVSVTMVEFYVDSVLVAGDASPPFAATWNPAGSTVGPHTLTARAYDAMGNVGTSAAVTVQYEPDAVAPTATMVAPAEGSVLTGHATLVASATDDVGMHSVSFHANGGYIGAFQGAPTTTSWQIPWWTFEWPNGPYELQAQARDTSGNTFMSAPVKVVVANTGMRYARYDSPLRVPKCAGASAICDSGRLLDGRGAFGGEVNAPNSLSDSPSCIDGNTGSYHELGSIDAIRVTSLNGGVLMPGSTVRMDVTVWARANYTLYLYTSDGVRPEAWTLRGTFIPPDNGAQVLSTTYTLGSSPMQAVRAVYRWYSTGASLCANGEYNDNDDLVFEVGQADTTAPGVWMLAPAEGAQVQGAVELSAAAADVVGVTRVEFYDGATLVGTDTAAPYAVSWDASAAGAGAHTLTARAYDAAGNAGTSTAVNVTVP
jgi:ethanolamine utilization microcompartment shell protein EutS